ncbi:FUSC family protein, partial [Ramlibacter sp.]|uniref:FUSC family protein n=1 Tax=Ramlibacter sp. TaxID=1917967 RepID=UPI002609076B
GGRDEGPARDALHDLRTGADIVALQGAREGLPRGVAEVVLRELAALFFGRRALPLAAQAGAMLPRLDAALDAAVHQRADDDAQRRALAALVGLRRNLFPDAPPVRPAVPMPGEPR